MEEMVEEIEIGGTEEHRPKGGRRFSNFVLAAHDVGRIELCPASAVFVGPRDEKMHPSQWHGIFIHRFLQYVVEKGRDQALAYIKSKRQKYVLELCTRMDLSTVPMDGIAEMTISINTETMKGETYERDVLDPRTHIASRADIVTHDDAEAASKRCGKKLDFPGELWHVADYKTGKPTESDVTQSVQMMTLATGLQLMEDDQPDALASLVWVEKSGNLLWHTKLIPSKQLRKHARRVRRAHILALEIRDEYKQEGLEPEYHPGAHCFGCRMEKTCHVAQLAGVVGK